MDKKTKFPQGREYRCPACNTACKPHNCPTCRDKATEVYKRMK